MDTHCKPTVFQLLDLCEVIPGLKHLLQSDNYHLSSLIHLLDLSVGPAALHITQRVGHTQALSTQILEGILF